MHPACSGDARHYIGTALHGSSCSLSQILALYDGASPVNERWATRAQLESDEAIFKSKLTSRCLNIHLTNQLDVLEVVGQKCSWIRAHLEYMNATLIKKKIILRTIADIISVYVLKLALLPHANTNVIFNSSKPHYI